MAYTLAQQYKLEQDASRKYVIDNLLRKIKIMEVLPFSPVDSLKTSAFRWRVLPDVGFRNINGVYTEDTSGDVEEVWESLYIMGGMINFDRIFPRLKNTFADPKKLQLDMKLLSLALKFNDYFVNGDQATDILGFEGLKKRVEGLPSRQKVLPTAGGATALIVTADTASVGKFWTAMEKAHLYCNGGDVQAILMNEDMKLGLGRSLRYANLAAGAFLDVTKDSFDRNVPTYKGVPIFDAGLKKDQTTQIITNTETAADAGADATSIYFMSFNEMQGIVGVELPPGLEVVPDAQKDVATVNKTLIEWVLGLAGFGSYGITRIWNISDPNLWTN